MRNELYSILKSERGFALVTVLLMVSLLAIIGTTLNRTGGLQTTISSNLKAGDEARYMADAGIQHALFLLKINPELTGNVFTNEPFSTGSYTVSISSIIYAGTKLPLGNVLISSTGTTGTASSTVEKRVTTDELFTVYPQLIKDTYLSQNKSDTNYGVSDQINIGCWRTDPDRGLFEYDLSVIPADAIIVSAVFELYMYGKKRQGINSNEINVRVYWMTRSWNEGEANIGKKVTCTNGATWETTDCATSWTVLGGDYDSNTVDETIIYYDDPDQWYQWDVMNLINDWLNLQMSNFGMVLKDNNEAGNSRKFVGYFYSKEYSDVNLRPKLTVKYKVND
jgi:hypothetical protein